MSAGEAGVFTAVIRRFLRGPEQDLLRAGPAVGRVELPWFAKLGHVPKNDAEWRQGVDHVIQKMTPSADEVVWRKTDEPLYRYDDRPPGRLLDGYFTPHDYVDADLFQHIAGRSGFVSTTRNAEMSWSGRFQYELSGLGGGIDVDATAGARMYGGTQQEVAFPGGFPARFVSRWRSVLNPEELGRGMPPKFSEWVTNPRFDPSWERRLPA
ncbi:scabin-related ADP-ribosyltransferase [Actinoallomurus iriomotensis]|uniref:Pierisin-like domain-containing protein n=1 Tax=Actinoallomurus iriomotensis TaxID=478107 RepID=A0A9W6RXZ2_9ACTN|nr:hypothetical protein [Actinoallomurus iriomotensis]GLY81925.1 hypothetical protein Airi01_101920 [Actinoallomurus iriomotensis]